MGPDKACSWAIERMLRQLPPDQRDRTTVAVVALNKAGEAGGGTTIGPENLHHHDIANPDPKSFQYAVWRDRGVHFSNVSAPPWNRSRAAD